MILWAIWYTFDDWLASTAGRPWVGDVPVFLAIFVELLFWIVVGVFIKAFGKDE